MIGSREVELDAEKELAVEGSRMPWTKHLSELATRLKRSLFVFIFSFVAVMSVPDPFHPFGGPSSIFGFNFLLISLLRRAEEAYAPGYKFFPTSMTTPISVFVNLSLVLALVISLPYAFIQIYGFIASGLYHREKRAVRKYAIPFAALFTTGSLFGLFVVFPIVMRILLSFFEPFGLTNLVSVSDFLNLLLVIPAVTGMAFTFPVFVIPLVEFKIVKAKQLSAARKWVYVGVALIVGLINPDPTFISSVPIILPIYILFEATVILSKRIEKKRALKSQTEHSVPN